MSDLIVRNNLQEKAELDIQITTAKAYPRDIKKFISDAIAMATINEETAASCIYSVPRGIGSDRKMITGESIRLAEILNTCWGNMHVGSRVVENDGKTVTAEGVSWDLEKNVKVVKHAQRNIKNKEGKTFSEDMQTLTANAAQAIALRNAILANIPRIFSKEVYNAAVNFAVGTQEKVSKKIDAVIDRFGKMGIEKDKILTYLGKEKESLTSEDLTEMIGVGTAIKDGSIKIDDAFVFIKNEPRESKSLSLAEKLKNNKKETKEKEYTENTANIAKDFFGDETEVKTTPPLS